MTTTFRSLVLTLALCLPIAAAAQDFINFNGLPVTGAPRPIPGGYAGMNWNGLYYITNRFSTDLQNVAFPALGTGAPSMVAVDAQHPYELLSISATGDYNSTLTLYAFNRGAFIGSHTYSLAPVLTPLQVPQEWGATTQVTFLCLDGQQRPAIFNLYSLTFWTRQ